MCSANRKAVFPASRHDFGTDVATCTRHENRCHAHSLSRELTIDHVCAHALRDTRARCNDKIAEIDRLMASAVPASPKSMDSCDPESRRVAVLLVDDDTDVRDLMAMSLHKNGFTTESASNGREAMELLKTLRPELIVLDLQMPVMDGHEFRENQRRDRRLLAIPTIVLSGSQLEPQLDPAIAGTLRKPARIAELLAWVRAYCTSAPAA